MLDGFFDVELGRSDDLAGAGNGGVEAPPAGHDLTGDEAEDQDECHRVGQFGESQRNQLEDPGGHRDTQRGVLAWHGRGRMARARGWPTFFPSRRGRICRAVQARRRGPCR